VDWEADVAHNFGVDDNLEGDKTNFVDMPEDLEHDVDA